jgi:hypothetical protein
MVAVSEGRRSALAAANEPIPVHQVIRALVDTGASHTSIEPAVLAKLGLTPTGKIEIVTPSTGTGTHTADTYDIDFSMYGALTEPPLLLTNLRVSTAELYSRQGIHALIGRDILSKCVLHYNGTLNQFTLAF